MIEMIEATASELRQALPIIPSNPIFSRIVFVNLFQRVALVGSAGPTTSSRTGSTGSTK